MSRRQLNTGTITLAAMCAAVIVIGGVVVGAAFGLLEPVREECLGCCK